MLLKINKVMVKIFAMLKVLLDEDSVVEDLLNSAHASLECSLFLS